MQYTMQYTKVFISILLILGALYFFFGKNDAQEKPGVYVTIGEYYFIDIEKIDRVELTSNNDITVLKKKSGDWSVDLPVKSPADLNSVKKLLSNITQNPVHRVLPTDQIEEFAEYGLDDVSKSVTLYGGGELLLDLKFGDENPDGTDMYAKKGGGNEIITTAIQIVDVFNFDSNTFRSRSPLNIDESAITSLKITYADSYWHFEKQEDTGNWYITEPQMFRAKNSKINRLLSQLISMKITMFLNMRFQDEISHGLNASGISVEITSKSAEGERVETVIFGDTNVAENAIYARLSSLPDEDVLIESSILNKLKLSEGDIREDSLFIVDPLQIETLDVRERGAKNLSIFKTPQGKWQIISPRSGDIDMDALKNFFEALSNLRPHKYISASELEKIDPDDTGFEAYKAKIEIKQRGGLNKLEILIGKKSRNNGYYTMVNDSDGACYVSDELIKKFFNANDRLKEDIE